MNRLLPVSCRVQGLRACSASSTGRCCQSVGWCHECASGADAAGGKGPAEVTLWEAAAQCSSKLTSLLTYQGVEV